jgi:TRAP-type C4-dicarboxylate transport system permease small subunit
VWRAARTAVLRLLEEVVPSAATFVMLVVVLYQVFMRYVLNRPPTWSDELARYLYIWMVFLGAARVSRRGTHITMEYLPARLRGRARSGLLLAHEALIVATLLYILGSSLVYYRFYARIPSPAMELPSAYLIVVLPVSGVLMLFHHLGRAVGHARGLRGR